MNSVRILSAKSATETWWFASIILLTVIGIAYIHSYYSNREYYTTRQIAEIKRITKNATDLINNRQDVSRQLIVLEVIHRLVNDEASQQIMGVQLSHVYNQAQNRH